MTFFCKSAFVIGRVGTARLLPSSNCFMLIGNAIIFLLYRYGRKFHHKFKFFRLLNPHHSYLAFSCEYSRRRCCCWASSSIMVTYRFKKFFNDIVEIPIIFDLSCNPLSEVSKIGLSSLYFKATESIMLSGDLLS